jgi:hypothetical protein
MLPGVQARSMGLAPLRVRLSVNARMAPGAVLHERARGPAGRRSISPCIERRSMQSECARQFRHRHRGDQLPFSVTPPTWLDAQGRRRPTLACWTCGRLQRTERTSRLVQTNFWGGTLAPDTKLILQNLLDRRQRGAGLEHSNVEVDPLTILSEAAVDKAKSSMAGAQRIGGSGQSSARTIRTRAAFYFR